MLAHLVGVERLVMGRDADEPDAHEGEPAR
jgi:hypothetical protein